MKGEGKNGKFAECASAYIRVGACPARRIEWEFVWGREVFERNKGGSRMNINHHQTKGDRSYFEWATICKSFAKAKVKSP